MYYIPPQSLKETALKVALLTYNPKNFSGITKEKFGITLINSAWENSMKDGVVNCFKKFRKDSQKKVVVKHLASGEIKVLKHKSKEHLGKRDSWDLRLKKRGCPKETFNTVKSSFDLGAQMGGIQKIHRLVLNIE